MEIRPPHKPNYPALAEMLTRATGQDFSAEGLAGKVMADQHFDPNLVFMAREKGETLGFLATVLEAENAWIKMVAVDPSRRRQGLAREMIERAQERLFGEGARMMRAGFGPGPLFSPGVPEGAAADFFSAIGYASEPGGLLAVMDEAGAEAPPPLAEKARELMKGAPLWWSEVEERLSFKVPRLGMSADGKALCLADPGLGVGPLFCSDEASAAEAVRAALGLAGTGRRLADFRPASWWQSRFGLSSIVNCFEFKKDLRGVSHA